MWPEGVAEGVAWGLAEGVVVGCWWQRSIAEVVGSVAKGGAGGVRLLCWEPVSGGV